MFQGVPTWALAVSGLAVVAGVGGIAYAVAMSKEQRREEGGFRELDDARRRMDRDIDRRLAQLRSR